MTDADFVVLDKQTVESILQLFRDAIRATERLAELGWTVPNWATPADLANLFSIAGELPIDAFMEKTYNEHPELFRRLREDILQCEATKPWHPLLRESFEAFEAGLTLVTIPSLLSVIEGVLASEKKTDTDMRRVVEERVAREVARFGAEGSITVATWRSIQSFIDKLYKTSSFARPGPVVLNRHWILHGRSASEWTRADALRLFHALDTISSAKERAKKKVEAS